MVVIETFVLMGVPLPDFKDSGTYQRTAIQYFTDDEFEKANELAEEANIKALPGVKVVCRRI